MIVIDAQKLEHNLDTSFPTKNVVARRRPVARPRNHPRRSNRLPCGHHHDHTARHRRYARAPTETGPPEGDRAASLLRPTPTPTVTPAPTRVAARTQAVEPARSPTPAASPTPSATPALTPSPALPTPEPPRPAPAKATPAPVPVAEPATEEVRATGLSPRSLRRGESVVLEVRGEGLPEGLTASILQGRRPAAGIRALRVEFVNSSLVRVSVLSDPELPLGGYTLILRSRNGVASPGLQIEVVV